MTALSLWVAAWLVSAATASPPRSRFAISASADQLIVVSGRTFDPRTHLAELRVYRRMGARSPWRLVYGPWQAEIGYAGLRDRRREGDGSTPTGVFGIGTRIFGVQPNPGGLHLSFHRLVCGDWWDEDRFSARYNRFVHLPCDARPRFAPRSEALWADTVAYRYFAVIRFNVHPTIRGPGAPGSGIFLHSWVWGATAGCLALPEQQLLAVLRWLRPTAHPQVAIGTVRELTHILSSRSLSQPASAPPRG